MMLLQPQRSTRAHQDVVSNTYNRKNNSTTSFTSSSNNGCDLESSHSIGMYHSNSSRDHHQLHQPQRGPLLDNGHDRCPPNAPHHPSSTGESSDAEYTKFATTSRRSSKKQDSSKSSSGMGTLKGLGRRLFNRSSSNLKTAPMLASRSQSASSSSTSAQSPPLTPTSPPHHVQPIWLPNGQKDFFSNFSNLPASINVADVLNTPDEGYRGFSGVSPKTKQGAFSESNHFPNERVSENTTFDGDSSCGHASSTFSHYSSVSSNFPSAPNTITASAGFSSNVNRRDIPAVIEEEGDSDFLRAVLNFGEGGEEKMTPSSCFRGGRAAPLPTRSSSLGQITGIGPSPSSFLSPSPRVVPPPRRGTDGRVILTQEAAKNFAADKRQMAGGYVVVHKRFRKGLFGKDGESESEDEYGNDGEEDEADTTPVASSAKKTTTSESCAAAAVAGKDNDQAARYPSSLATNSRTRSPSTDGPAIPNPRPPGLDTGAKKSLYNCTLLKVHQHLAPTLAGDAEARNLIPVIAAGEILYNNEDLRFPRSVNSQSKLSQHSTTYGFTRNLQVALARTEVMRKLRRERLRIEEEVEISWFQRRYGSSSIAPELIGKALRQRQLVSPEALAKPPIAAPQNPRRLSGIHGEFRGARMGEKNGIITWAKRKTFTERTVVLLPAEEFGVGEVLVDGSAKLATGRSTIPQGMDYSPRIRVLAGLPNVDEERLMKYPMLKSQKLRPRDMQSKRVSRLGSASEGTVWEGQGRHSASGRPPRGSPLASPRSQLKRLPPWMAPRSPQLQSPQMGPERAASEGVGMGLGMVHQNCSTASIPEVTKEKEEGGDEDRDENGDAGDSSDEEVPLAQLQTFRAQRAVEKERIHKLEAELALLRQKDSQREREEEERKNREEEARRTEAERVYEERKAALEARRLEKNRKLLQEARDRRGFTRQSVLMAEPNYGAGNPLLGHNKPKPSGSPSSPNLAIGEPTSPGGRDGALAKLQGNNRSSTSLYVQGEGQRRSRTSVVAQPVEQTLSPIASPRMQASATAATPRLNIHRQSSMASLVASPQTLSQRGSMAQLPTSPQITQRRTSLMPPDAQMLHHATSMQQLAPGPTSPYMLSPGLMADPRHSMSMTSLNAQAYFQAQQQAHMGFGGVQRPSLVAQTYGAMGGKVSSRARPGLGPLVSLYGDVVPASALQRRT
ncbi:uncharacterized protein MEPE_00433 [Melanopsichium pennsylvanicum]|uniref:Uncharacterized protein n=2 Tax=Melanopsichium pennsylvanicum TaxID=63383 RepID=A0AAJ4XIE5_9BASI|nr:hypothetical protein BN887_00329 [Melanopsichium pennsylvanicum 4]SNX81728.1 uncharacterized protein MEPE_00433 [Melanopsichium pennsylvanicum]